MEGSVATPAQGAPPAPAQPAATGQGQAGAQPTGAGKGGGDSFNWGLFPNVPENQRELLQPHLTGVLGHVTQLEQKYAPYKGLMDAVQPDQAQNLVQFLHNYTQDPKATWLGLAQSLQQDGMFSNPAFSVDQLQALIDMEQQQQAASVQGAQGMGAPEEMAGMPPWAQTMMQSLQAIEAREQQREQQAQAQAAQEEARQQDALLQEAHTTIKGQLTAAGIPDGLVTPEQMTAALIAHRGDINAVVQSFSGLREGFLKTFAEQNGQGPRPPTINGATPEAPKGGLRTRKGDGFREASLGAQQMLAQAASATGQGN